MFFFDTATARKHVIREVFNWDENTTFTWFRTYYVVTGLNKLT